MRKFLASFAIAATMAFAGPASAATYLFELTGFIDTASWTLDSSPTPDIIDAGFGFAINNVSGNFNGSASNSAVVEFYSASNLGGFAVGGPGFNISFNGPQFYTGPETAPTLIKGTFLLSFGHKLVISEFKAPTGAVPEPASWAMMLAGFGLVGFAARRKAKVQTSHATA